MRIAALSLLLALALPGQTRERLTLEDAENLALRNHPSIDASRYEALATEERVNQTRAALRPVATASFTAVGADNGSRMAAGGLNNPVLYSRMATGVNVSQMLLDFGRTSRLIESDQLRAAAAGERVKESRADVLLSVRRAYFTALRAETVLRVARATVEARQLVVDQISELVKAQLKSSLDLSVVQSNLAEAKLLLASAENDRQAAHARLAEAIGRPPLEMFELVDRPLAPVEPLTLNELREAALQNRPELLALRLERQSAEQLAAAENTLKYPTVSAVASTGVLPRRTSNLQTGYAAAGLNISLPFLNGGLYKSRQAEAELRARAALNRTRELENRVLREVTVAWLAFNTARERVSLSEQFVEQARQSVELAQARYDLGLSSVIELSQAQLVLTNAEIQFAAARYDLQIERAHLAWQAGTLR